MLWFKHKSDARNSLKLRKVRRKYGADGYAIYWFCLEAIAYEVDKDNLTFDLREDAETIGFELSVQEKRVEEIMRYMIEIGLFETSGSVITCLKLAESIDKSMTNSPKMRKWLGKQKLLNESGDVMTCADTVKTCAELEVEVEKEVEKNKHSGQQVDLEDVIQYEKVKQQIPYDQIFDLYDKHIKNNCHAKGFFRDGFLKNRSRVKHLNARWNENEAHRDLQFWDDYFMRCSNVKWIREGISGEPVCDIDKLLNKTKFYKFVEEFYA